MMRMMTSKFAGKLSLPIVVAMLLPMVAPAIAAAGQVPKEPVVVSSFTDGAGSININSGKAEGIRVGYTGIIIREGKQIAQYRVEQVHWGFSRIALSNLAEGYTVKSGDDAPITGYSGATSARNGKRASVLKTVGIVLGVGLVAYLLTRHSGNGGSASSDDGGITLKAEKTTTYGDEDTSVITITANVKSLDGNTAPDGTAVTFSTTTGTLNHTTTTTTGGKATATLTAATTEESAVVTVKSLSRTVTITVSFGASMDIATSQSAIQLTGSGGAHMESTITATCRDANGDLATSGTVKFSSSIGTFADSEVTISSGVASTTFSSTATGIATVAATWSGTKATTEITVTAGPPYAIAVSSSSSSLSCDGSSHGTITAAVTDVAGNSAANGTIVSFAVTADGDGGGNGSIVSEAQTSGGKATAILYTKDSGGTKSKSGTATVTASVVAANQPGDVPAPASDISGTTSVKFVSNEVGAINLGASKTNIRGWDVVGNSTTITAVVRDTDGYAVPDGTAVTFSATHGMISNTTTTASGSATATLTTDASGSGSWDGLVDVTATAGGVTETASDLVIFSGAPVLAKCTAAISQSTLAKSGGQAIVAVEAYDVNGNPVVDGTAVTATTSKGTVSPSSGATVGGAIMFTLATSADAASPTESGDGVVTISIESGNGGLPVKLTAPFTVSP